jgi:predicted Rossmann fold nucleotide-binding protein DprA/Smf involved in DNA uptake
VTVAGNSLAALLLTNRIVDIGVKPLSASEFWSLCHAIGDPSLLIGMSAEDIAEKVLIPLGDAERYAALLAAGTAFAFERERLAEEGVRLISALDDAFPARLRHRLRDACPSFLLVGGPVEFLDLDAIGVVGSRDASAKALEVAATTSRVAQVGQVAVASGLARGIDQAAMAAALDDGVPVVGVPAEGVRVAARSPAIRRRVHAGELCITSPYGPAMRFTAGNAMGRNKIIYALANVTMVVCAQSGSGGTWEGAREAMRRGFGRVAVWTGEGAGPGNAKLLELGGVGIGDVTELLEIEPVEASPVLPTTPSLFD